MFLGLPRLRVNFCLLQRKRRLGRPINSFFLSSMLINSPIKLPEWLVAERVVPDPVLGQVHEESHDGDVALLGADGEGAVDGRLGEGDGGGDVRGAARQAQLKK